MTDVDNIKILVVDDLPEKLLVYSTILEEPGQQVICADSGNAALRQILDHEFAVILLDVNMPGMDGFETASIIRSRKRCAHTPIIFLTADSDEMHAVRGYAHGAVDYILTPVVPEILRAKVRVFAELLRKTTEVQRHQEALRDFQAIEHQRALHQTSQQLELALEAGRMGSFEWDLGLRLRRWSPSFESIFGFAPGGFTGAVSQLHSCIDAQDRRRVLKAAHKAERTDGQVLLEYRITRLDGVEGWIEMRGRVAPVERGRKAAGMIGVCLDISRRKRAEAELDLHRAHLEELVRERTLELQQSHERIRLNDRMAAIGTLAAGLGHDMGNLLLPMRMRLDSLAHHATSAEAQEDITAIADSCEYVKRLTQGLRLFALNPDDTRATGVTTNLSSWWPDVAPLFRNVLHRDIRFTSTVPNDLPGVTIAPHILTQAVYNLLQNASDVLKGRGGAEVTVSARLADDRRTAVLEITDNGPGMSPDVLRRCLEPFFTTKSRAISTGLGLSLVRAAVYGAGGTLDIKSEPGAGTSFQMMLPVGGAIHAADTAPATPDRACVSISAPRTAAYVATILPSMGIETATGRWPGATNATLLILDNAMGRASELEAFLTTDPMYRAVVLGAVPEGIVPDRIIPLDAHPTAAQIRAAIGAGVRRAPSPRTQEIAV